MIKRAVSALMVLLIVMGLCACGSTEQGGRPLENGTQTEPFVFTDDLGRTVTVSKTDRVAAMLGSYADMWLLAGGSVCASADDAWEDFHLQLPEEVVNLGSAHRPNIENLLASEPDFVLASSKLSKHKAAEDLLNSAKIPVAYLDVGDFESFLRVFEWMTTLTGKPQLFEEHGTLQKEKIDSILDRRTSESVQTVLVMRASAASIRAKNSDGTMLGGMLRDFGCVNIADSDSMLLENLNIESILQENPDKIFFVQTGDDLQGIRDNVERMFEENPLWKQLDAVKNGAVFYMDKQLYNLKPNARFAEAYEQLEKILYEN